jgi:hypothetical protein
MKTIKITIEHQVEVPDNAEIVTFDLEGFPQSHVLKMAGQLYRPDLAWMKYHTREMNKKRYVDNDFHAPSFETVSVEEWEMFQSDIDYTWQLEEESAVAQVAPPKKAA